MDQLISTPFDMKSETWLVKHAQLPTCSPETLSEESVAVSRSVACPESEDASDIAHLTDKDMTSTGLKLLSTKTDEMITTALRNGMFIRKRQRRSQTIDDMCHEISEEVRFKQVWARDTRLPSVRTPIVWNSEKVVPKNLPIPQSDVQKKSKSTMMNLDIPKLNCFIVILCVHSLFMTSSTPIARFLDGHWTQTDSFTEILRYFRIIDNGFKRGGYNTSTHQDTNLKLHALFGITWLFVGTVQMVLYSPERHGNKWGGPNAKIHKWFGKVAALALFFHLGTACSLLFADTLQHTWMNKLALAMDLATPVSLAWMGMEAILFRKKKNISKHIDCMVRCFIHSIEGAGTIRTVHILQMICGDFGPAKFIAQFTSVSSTEQGQWEYLLRMFLIRWLSNVYIAIYVYYIRNSDKMKKDFQQDMKSFAVATVVVYIGSIFDQQETVTNAFLLTILFSVFQIACKLLYKKSNTQDEFETCTPMTPYMAKLPLRMVRRVSSQMVRSVSSRMDSVRNPLLPFHFGDSDDEAEEITHTHVRSFVHPMGEVSDDE